MYPIKYYSYWLKNIDWSLNRVPLEQFRVTSVWCDCPRCQGLNKLLDWPKRSFVKWNGEPGVCPYVTALQLSRIALHRQEPIDPDIVEKLVRVSRQL